MAPPDSTSPRLERGAAAEMVPVAGGDVAPLVAAGRQSFLVGLIGAGIQASRTPAMHEREGDYQGFRYIYKRIDLDLLALGTADLPELLSNAERLGYSGLNITFPCKQAILPLLHELSPEASAIGAVNTVVFHNGRRIGYNTDCYGFAESFRRGMLEASLKRVAMVGAGGAGAAVAAALLGMGAEQITIFDIDRSRSDALATMLGAKFGPHRLQVAEGLREAIAWADGLVNTTPVGMARNPGTPVPEAFVRPELWVADVIYFPAETELLRLAGAKGCRTISGAGMAVFQAVEAFRLFTGRMPDAERMQRHFEAAG